MSRNTSRHGLGDGPVLWPESCKQVLFQGTQGCLHMGWIRTSITSDETSRISLKAQLYHFRGKMPSSWRTSKQQLWISKQVFVEQIVSVAGREMLPQSPPVGEWVRQAWLNYRRPILGRAEKLECCKGPPALRRSWGHVFPWKSFSRLGSHWVRRELPNPGGFDFSSF